MNNVANARDLLVTKDLAVYPKLKMNFLILITVITFAGTKIDGARILGIMHVPGFSHQRLGQKLMIELANRGHEVTYLSPMVPDKPVKNFKPIEIKLDMQEDETINMFEQTNMGMVSKMVWLDTLGLTLTETILNQTEVQTLLKSNQQFDVIIIEQFLNEGMRGFCHHFDAPCIMLSTIGTSRWTNPQMGNPGPPSYIADLFLNFSSKMNFWERFYNSLVYLGAELFTHLYTMPKHNELLQKYFPGAPHLYDLYYNTSLMLLNSHVSTNAPVPQVPNMIDIGGFHVNAPQKLPDDLQAYMDGAKDGVIFFSMGSNLKSKDMHKEQRETILRVFSKLKQKILWKWEDETLPGQPPNVKLGKWLPQQDILAHPNLRLFLTHGGLLSTIESIYHGVPVVGIPIYGDQEMNVANAEIAGFGVGVPYQKLTEESLSEALDKVLNDPKYTENAKSRAKIMHDQPMKPLDRAVFWVEYVMRHQGAPHLRSAALNLAWYQYLLLDVVVGVVLAILVLAFVVCKLLIKVFGKNKIQVLNKGKKNR